MKIPYLLLLVFAYPFCESRAQDSLKFNNRKYKWEVGIDMQNIFRGDPGSALIFKKRKTIGKLVPLTYSNNLRYLVALNGAQTINYKFSEDEKTDLYVFSYNASQFSRSNIEVLLGYERIDFFGKFNLYYGLDAGLNFSAYNPTRISYYLSNSNDIRYFYDKFQSFGPVIMPFFGVKYRISERFSITAESGLRLSYLFNKRYWNEESINPRTTFRISTEKYQTFNYNFDFLRFLSLNYHLRQY